MAKEFENWPEDIHPANYVMKGNKPKPAVNAPQSPEIDATALGQVESMDHARLVALVRRMACQCGLVAMMTEEETAQAMLDTLAHTALKPVSSALNMRADIDSRLKAVDKWLDRTQGKAIQRIDQRILNVGNGSVDSMTSAELMVAVAKIKQLPDGVMLLADGTLDIVDHDDPPTTDQ